MVASFCFQNFKFIAMKSYNGIVMISKLKCCNFPLVFGNACEGVSLCSDKPSSYNNATVLSV